MKIRAFMQKYHKLTKTNKAVYKQLVRYLRLHPHQEEVAYIIKHERMVRIRFDPEAKRERHPPEFQCYLFYDKYSATTSARPASTRSSTASTLSTNPTAKANRHRSSSPRLPLLRLPRIRSRKEA